MLFLWFLKIVICFPFCVMLSGGGWILLFDVFKYFLLIHERIPSFSLVLLFILSQFSPDYKYNFLSLQFHQFITPYPMMEA